MTNSEAIEILKNTVEHIKVYEDDIYFTSDFAKAYEKAIQALEEKKQEVIEFVEKMEEWNNKVKSICNENAFFTIEDIHKVAQQIKEGVNNE